jgi:ABC-type proline/glycine betaine transport system permease subunit
MVVISTCQDGLSVLVTRARLAPCDTAKGFESGLVIVVVAIMLDRRFVMHVRPKK